MFENGWNEASILFFLVSNSGSLLICLIGVEGLEVAEIEVRGYSAFVDEKKGDPKVRFPFTNLFSSKNKK